MQLFERFPKPHQVWLFHRTPRTQHVVVLMLVIYYSERIPSKISKGKRHTVRSLQETRRELAGVLSPWSYCMYFIPPASDYDNTCEMLSSSTRVSPSLPFFVHQLKIRWHMPYKLKKHDFYNHLPHNGKGWEKWHPSLLHSTNCLDRAALCGGSR